MSQATRLEEKNLQSYNRLDKINGDHPLKEILPDGYIAYKARLRKGGKVSYFNFDLAKEMGLLPKDHKNELNDLLIEKLLQTFSIQIINEYDIQNNKIFPKSEIKDGTYMATRYLQLQHSDKIGKNSGDGRSIWNGRWSYRGKSWDISSCGTGGTALSPATSKFNKFFESGDPSISYGCGYAEVDEGLATSLMSKVFKNNGIKTEDSLCVIEFKNNISINVRVHKNLLRPSHFFLYLKQNRIEELRTLIDYYIEEIRVLPGWERCPSSSKKYDFFIEKFCETFAEMAADFEDKYIFCWLDWDGDNILMDGSIIDYGSVRQFGLFHHEYRYDDIERFSTNILEQKRKARDIVQVMEQAVESVKKNEKQTLSNFSKSNTLHNFERVFDERKKYNLLSKMGFSERKIRQILKREPKLVSQFLGCFQYFEKLKSKDGRIKISDGVTWDVIFNMRKALRELPHIFIVNPKKITPEDLLDVFKAETTKGYDLSISSYRKRKLNEFQFYYLKLVKKVAKLFQEPVEKTLTQMSVKAQLLNKAHRITGDAVTHIVQLLMQERRKMSTEEFNDFIDEFCFFQKEELTKPGEQKSKHPSALMIKAMDILIEYGEGI